MSEYVAPEETEEVQSVDTFLRSHRWRRGIAAGALVGVMTGIPPSVAPDSQPVPVLSGGSPETSALKPQPNPDAELMGGYRYKSGKVLEVKDQHQTTGEGLFGRRDHITVKLKAIANPAAQQAIRKHAPSTDPLMIERPQVDAQLIEPDGQPMHRKTKSDVKERRDNISHDPTRVDVQPLHMYQLGTAVRLVLHTEVWKLNSTSEAGDSPMTRYTGDLEIGRAIKTKDGWKQTAIPKGDKLRKTLDYVE